MWVEVFLTPPIFFDQLGVPQLNSVLTLSTQTQHLTPQVRAHHHRLPTSAANHKPRWLPELLTHWLQIKGFHDAHLGFD